MLPEYCLLTKQVQSRLNAQCSLHQEAHYSILPLGKKVTDSVNLTHRVQVTVDDRKRVHCDALFIRVFENDKGDSR